MRPLRPLTITGALVLLSGTAARARHHSVVAGLSLKGIPHPVSIPLAVLKPAEVRAFVHGTRK